MAAVFVVCLAVSVHAGAVTGPQSAPGSAPVLSSSARPPVPRDLSLLWLVPADTDRRRLPAAFSEFASGVRLYLDGKLPEALPRVSAAALRTTELADHADYYRGLVLIGLGRVAEARQAFQSVRARGQQGYLAEAAALREAEAAEALGEVASALVIYEDLSARKTAQPDDVWLRLAKAAEAAGDRARAAGAWLRLLYDFPLSELARVAATELPKYQDLAAVGGLRARRARELARAERLFAASRYTDARAVFDALRPVLAGDEAALAGLRIAECDYHLRRYRAARDGTRQHLQRAPYQAEALFFHLSAIRRLGDVTTFVRLSRQLVDKHPTTRWAEEALNNLASYYVVADQNEAADKVFREILQRFPDGRYAERAAWKAGWWAFRHGRYRETVRVFEETAALFPRSDYRPAYLYWSARAYEKLGDAQAAAGRYSLATTDYVNTYYGRLATARLDPAVVVTAGQSDGDGDAPARAVQVPARPPTAPLIGTLLGLGLDELALDELLHAERQWGASPATQATIAYVHNRMGELRRGINLMKRAYPQYMAEVGRDLPLEIVEIIFPLAYWKEIQQHAASNKLDPFLVAALVAQESTFQADIRSSANAIGLMQIIPATGRRLARQVGITRFTTAMLTRPETSLRLGTFYLGTLLRQFGDIHLALAGYNAGEHRVKAWLAERPPLDQDEFIDDIPFPETQNYVKRILGTAEDYRKLYGSSGARVDGSRPR